MAVYIPIEKTVALDAPLAVDRIHGTLFMQEKAAHKFIISLTSGGEPMVLDDTESTVTAYFLRSDGTTIMLGNGAVDGRGTYGAVEDGKAAVILHKDCYNVSGAAQLTVFATSPASATPANSSVATCVYAAVMNVQRSTSATIIDSGAEIPDIQAYTQSYNDCLTATQDANNAAAAVPAFIADEFSTSKTYAVGDYAYRSGNLYRFTAAHTAGAWNASHVTQVRLANEVDAEVENRKAADDELKSAMELDNVNVPEIWQLGNIGLSSGNNNSANPNTRMRTIGFISDNIASISKISGNYVLYAYDGSTYIGHWNGTDFDTTTSVTTLKDVDLGAIRAIHPTYKYRLVWYLSSSYTPVPSTDYANIILYNAIYSEINSLQEQIDDIGEDIDRIIAGQDEINNKNYIGNLGDSSTWELGQIGTSTGNNGTSQSRMRTKDYISDYTYQISAKTGKFVLFAYDPTAETPYVGVWAGDGFEKTSSYSQLTSFVLADIKTVHPTYKFRLMWYLSSSYTPVPETDYVNVVIANQKTAIAYGVTLQGANIVNMGDSIFGLHYAPVDISTFISQATGATCYNCAFPGTRAVTRDSGGKAKFDLTTLVDAVISGDFSAQDAVKEAATSSTDYDHLPTLESVDFSNVDIITLAYGTNDYGGDIVIGTAGNGDASTFIGAMQEAIGKLETAFPKARIFVCTPIYRSWHNESTYENADTRQNANSNTLLDFVNAVKTVGQAEYIDCIDNHWIGINAKTRTTYTTDGTHPNEDGRRLIARHMAKELY